MCMNIWPACTTCVRPAQTEMHPPADTSSLIKSQASAEDQWAYIGREALFNATSKWLKAVAHDASNILIQIKGGMWLTLSPWMWPCWWTSYWATPDGNMIDVRSWLEIRAFSMYMKTHVKDMICTVGTESTKKDFTHCHTNFKHRKSCT